MLNDNTISAPKLVRNLAAAINHVRNTGKSLAIVKGNQSIAVLAPPPMKGLSIDQLIKVLENLPSIEDKDQRFSKDLETIRQSSKLPGNPWE
ncbi:MAG: hypothetical protein D8M58_20385 [Calditrichaeota bacterium]|nr:MAG: hypothetical protein DWQ03_14370 [Calditrichota bacterium]MBL1207769.1 hypothetical protein [Calditrichota bacterium]NOG47602.1 hypothetical protein [Calditrichota bacterium]